MCFLFFASHLPHLPAQAQAQEQAQAQAYETQAQVKVYSRAYLSIQLCWICPRGCNQASIS